MDMLLVCGLGLLAVGFIGLGIHPKTRPWAMRLWWLFLAAGVGLVGALLGRRRGDDWGEDADSTLVDIELRAKERAAIERAEQQWARDKSAEAINAGNAERAEIGEMTDRQERLKAYAKLGNR